MEGVGGDVAIEVLAAYRVGVVDDLDLQDRWEQLTAGESDRVQPQLDGFALRRGEGRDVDERLHVRVVGVDDDRAAVGVADEHDRAGDPARVFSIAAAS